ncbi:nucleotide exchange factor GrpE [Gelatiniphilus marinus]|uniref:Protein GrpE n=1 Tax=Gelatiniphilus marinus TaxID=1759464 RepID=A0ABW5JN94_9FLAO
MSKKDKKNIEAQEAENTQTETVDVEENKEEQTQKQTVEEKLKDEIKQEKDKFLRLFAEFENYKRRTAKERIELFATASEDVMLTLLPILDDFERAITHIEEDKEAEELRKGVLLIYQKLVKTLEHKGLKAMAINQGDDFNADNHEAVTQVPAPSKDLKGKIIDVVEKGYTLGDKIIRFPKVVIGQ